MPIKQHPILAEIQRQGLPRRRFLRHLLFAAGSVQTATWLTACGTSDAPVGGRNPMFRSPFETMGPLLPPDENGVQLPAGFTSRVIAEYNQPPIPSQPDFRWHSDPDGAGMFRTEDGGWIYVSNSEARDATTLFGFLPEIPILSELATRETVAALGAITGPITGLLQLDGRLPLILPLQGGASALRFDRDGNLVDAYPIERNTTTNCSGGATPWGTWINGEEIHDGYMFECSPLRDGGTPRRLDRFGRKAHEQVAVDERSRIIYHTEDITGSDRFYRTVFPEAAWPAGGRPDMDQGVLQVLAVDAGLDAARLGPVPVRWVNAVDDGTPQPFVYQEETTIFAGNEGLWFLNDFVFFSTKSDDNIWAIDTIGGTIESIYNPEDGPIGSPVDPNEPPLAGVDNITMTLDGEMIVVEDGGHMRAMVLLPDGRTIPLLRLPGPESGPLATEVTGPAFSPDGRRLYVANQRARRDGTATFFGSGGVIYEITMPFSVRVDPPLARPL